MACVDIKDKLFTRRGKPRTCLKRWLQVGHTLSVPGGS